MKKSSSITLASILVLPLLWGCETSNQNYTNNNRVVAATPTSYQPQQQYSAPAARPAQPAPSPRPVQQSYPNRQPYKIAPATPAQPQQYAYQEPLPPAPQPQPVYQQQEQQVPSPEQIAAEQQEAASSGNWLDLDSAAAQQDVSNTVAAQEVIAARQNAKRYESSIQPTAGSDQYRVVKGDTLYSIAFRYGLDYHSLAKINNIQPPFNLAVGQLLTLKLKASAPKVYVVQPGDTLYSIAKKHGQSVPFLAGANNLQPPYSLSAGQRLVLSRDNVADSTNTRDMEVPVAGTKPTPVVAEQKPSTPATSSSSTQNSVQNTSKPEPVTAKTEEPKAPTVAQTPIINTKTRKVSGVTWSWPTSGRVVEQFSTAEQGNKGVDIAGKHGQPILSAADGQVVYSGSALRGFGNLLIINHSNEYLSAYAHNDVLLVKEGQKVKRGQQIARMGNTDASSVRLHFEIRYRGQSVNPVNYLPK